MLINGASLSLLNEQGKTSWLDTFSMVFLMIRSSRALTFFIGFSMILLKSYFLRISLYFKVCCRLISWDFVKIYVVTVVQGFSSILTLTIFAKRSIVNAWQGSKYPSAFEKCIYFWETLNIENKFTTFFEWKINITERVEFFRNPRCDISFRGHTN